PEALGMAAALCAVSIRLAVCAPVRHLSLLPAGPKHRAEPVSNGRASAAIRRLGELHLSDGRQVFLARRRQHLHPGGGVPADPNPIIALAGDAAESSDRPAQELLLLRVFFD